MNNKLRNAHDGDNTFGLVVIAVVMMLFGGYCLKISLLDPGQSLSFPAITISPSPHEEK